MENMENKGLEMSWKQKEIVGWKNGMNEAGRNVNKMKWCTGVKYSAEIYLSYANPQLIIIK